MQGQAGLGWQPLTGRAWSEGAEAHDGGLVPFDAKYVALARFALWFESSDRHTYGHCERVAGYASDVGSALGLDQAEVAAIRLGAYMHDVGKIRVPQNILNKPGRLTAAEFDVMKMHPIWGLEMLEGVGLPFDVRASVRSHHEKCDGSGYPDGLRGDGIPLHAAIIGIADVYDALTSSRSYRPAMPGPAAMAEMHQRRGWWRSEVYAAFRRAAAGSPQAYAAIA